MSSTNNPYIGPEPFKRNDILYGRRKEIQQLKALLIAQRIVLLHSPSGAGKTSLIQAGLIPELIKSHFYVFPLIRFYQQPPDAFQNIKFQKNKTNRYVLSTLLCLEEIVPVEQQIPLDRLVEMDLETYFLNRLSPADEPRCKVLIFDQFEEVLTSSSSDREQKEEFFAQMGSVLYHENIWALFSMREDHLPALSPYLRPIPNRLQVTFRLDLLGVDAARQAIQLPAFSAGVNFTEGAVQKLIDDLRAIQVQQFDGTIHTEPGLSVEPVQLQVVCFQLWERKPQDQACIDIPDLATTGHVDQSLAAYYQTIVAEIVKQTQVKERDLREWFDRKLILPGNIRGQVPLGQVEQDGIPMDAVNLLIDAHLIRGEKHGGVTWYELAHDRFIVPIHQDNLGWRNENLAVWQVQADLWNMQGRPDRLLLSSSDLLNAKDLLEQNKTEFTDVEKQYLVKSQQVVAREEEIRTFKQREEVLKEQQRKEKEINQRKLIIGLSIGMIVTIGFAILSIFQRQTALDRLLLARLKAIDIRESRKQVVKFGLSIEAFRRLRDAESYEELWANTMTFHADDIRIRTNSSVYSICFSQDSRRLVSRSSYGIQVWDSQNGGQLLSIPLNTGEAINNSSQGKVICAPDNKILLLEPVEGGSNILALNIENGRQLFVLRHTSEVTDFDLSPDGSMLVSGCDDGSIILWNTRTGQIIDRLLDDNRIEIVKFRLQGDQVASVNGRGDVLFWDLADETTSRIQTGGAISTIAFHPNQRWLITGGVDGSVIAWDVTSGSQQYAVYLKETITALAFSPDGNRLYTASEDGVYKIWDVSVKPFIEVAGAVYYGPVLDATFSPDGQYIINGGMSGYAQVYGLGKTDRMGQAKTFYGIATSFGEGEVNHVLFSPDEKKFAAAIDTGEIIISSMSTNYFHHDSKIWDVHFSEDGQRIVTSSMDDTAKVWDSKTGEKVLEVTHGSQVLFSSIHPDGNMFATASFDHTAQIWSLPEGNPLLTIKHENAVSEVRFSPDGKYVGTASIDGTAQIWDLQNRTELFTIRHSSKVNHILFSPDSRFAITASDDHVIKIWDLKEKSSKYEFNQNFAILDIAISPDGKNIVSGDGGGNVSIWDMSTGKLLKSRKMGTSPVYKVAISSDNTLFAAGNELGNVCVWKLENSEQKLCFTVKQSIWDLTFSESNFIIAGSLDGYVYIWKTDTGKEYLRIANPGKVLSIDLSSDNKYLAVATSAGVARSVLWQREDILKEACLRLPRPLTKNEWVQYFDLARYDPYCTSEK